MMVQSLLHLNLNGAFAVVILALLLLEMLGTFLVQLCNSTPGLVHHPVIFVFAVKSCGHSLFDNLGLLLFDCDPVHDVDSETVLGLLSRTFMFYRVYCADRVVFGVVSALDLLELMVPGDARILLLLLHFTQFLFGFEVDSVLLISYN